MCGLLGKDGHGTRFIRFRGCDFLSNTILELSIFSRFYRAFGERGNVSRNAYKRNGFLRILSVFFAKGASKPPINDRFYKGLVTAFCSVLECKFSLGILRFLSIMRVHHRMLINVMVF